MATRKPTEPIQPFPADIDRNHFASWLSGFTDGEGCFRLSILPRTHSPYPSLTASFQIGQRADDVYILRLIRSYLECGNIYIDKRYYTPQPTGPKADFRVVNPADLVQKIIPHFDQSPLLAKKRRDYAIWCEGVQLLYKVFRRPQRAGNHGGQGNIRGRLPKWTSDEKEQFMALAAALKQQRQYQADTIPLPKQPPPAASDVSLFD